MSAYVDIFPNYDYNNDGEDDKNNNNNNNNNYNQNQKKRKHLNEVNEEREKILNELDQYIANIQREIGTLQENLSISDQKMLENHPQMSHSLTTAVRQIVELIDELNTVRFVWLTEVNDPYLPMKFWVGVRYRIQKIKNKITPILNRILSFINMFRYPIAAAGVRKSRILLINKRKRKYKHRS